MKINFPAALDFTLKFEGGWSDHPRDPGGATMKGITLRVYERFLGRKVSKAQLRAIPDDHLQAIYRTGYWDTVKGDLLPSGYDACMFDYSVNSGPIRAAKDDSALSVRLMGGERIKALCARRLGFLRSLSTFDVFGKGWTRRVVSLEAFCLKLAGLSAPALRQEAAKSASRAKQQGAAAATTGGAAAAAPAVQTIDYASWFALAAFVAVAVAVGVLAYKSWQQSRRKDAMLEAAGSV